MNSENHNFEMEEGGSNCFLIQVFEFPFLVLFALWLVQNTSETLETQVQSNCSKVFVFFQFPGSFLPSPTIQDIKLACIIETFPPNSAIVHDKCLYKSPSQGSERWFSELEHMCFA